MPEPIGPPVLVRYENWKGEVRLRRVQPVRFWYGSTEWHPGEQYLLDAIDIEDPARPVKSFALAGMLAWDVREAP